MGKKERASKADKRSAPTADKRSQPPKHPNSKHKSTKAAPTYADFAAQLASLRLRLHAIDGDGNCLFRSVADQVEGFEGRHAHYRQLACRHIAEQPDLYAPFIDGGADGGKAGDGLKAYVARMGRLGEWGGNLELVALARALQRDVVVHQLGAPRLVIDGGDAQGNSKGSRNGALHVAYHDAEHYSSVRRADDHSVHTEPLPITLPAPAASAQPTPRHSQSAGPTSDERRVMAATGIEDVRRVRAALRDLAGDVDSAVDVLNAEQEAEAQQPQPQPQSEVHASQQARVEESTSEDQAPATAEVGDGAAGQVRRAVQEAAVADTAVVKEVKAASKAKLSAKELKKALKADREEKKVQRAMERKLERIKERAQQAGEGGKENGVVQADGGTDSVVQDFGSLSI